MSKKPPNVGDKIRHFCAGAGREFSGVVESVLSAQFTYRVSGPAGDAGTTRFAKYDENWKVTEKASVTDTKEPPPLTAPTPPNEAPAATKEEAPPPLEPPQNPTEPEPAATFECTGCERAFTSKRGLKIHQGSCHKYRDRWRV